MEILSYSVDMVWFGMVSVYTCVESMCTAAPRKHYLETDVEIVAWNE